MPRNTPLISIITPCYNDGKYLRECLNSVHQQNYPSYEIIVINDGSSDPLTKRIIKDINHPLIKVIETPNKGVSIARNTAIHASSGKYILPLDADDKIGQNFIRSAIDILENNQNIKVVNCAVKLFGRQKGIIDYGDFSFEKLLAKNLLVVSSIFRRSDFDKTPGYNPNMKEGFEDWDFWISLLKTGGKVHKIKDVGFYYRIKTRSRNNSLHGESFRRLRLQVFENHRDIYAHHLIDPQDSFEYELISQSCEYKLGLILLRPFRKLIKWFHLYL